MRKQRRKEGRKSAGGSIKKKGVKGKCTMPRVGLNEG